MRVLDKKSAKGTDVAHKTLPAPSSWVGESPKDVSLGSVPSFAKEEQTYGPDSPFTTVRDETAVDVPNPKVMANLPKAGKDEETPSLSFIFQTFIPDKYVPGTGNTGFGDDRDFGKPGDRYRTYQKIEIPLNQSPSGSKIEPATQLTGKSVSWIPGITGHATPDGLKMAATQNTKGSTLVTFAGSIANGATIVGKVSPRIDFSGYCFINIHNGAIAHLFSVSHDAFPAYEAFVNDVPVYRWSYPLGNTMKDLLGNGTAIIGFRKTGERPGGTVQRAKIESPLEPLKKVALSYSKPQPYKVRSGDTLSALSLKFLGDNTRWPEIYEDNKGVIGGNHNDLRVGSTLMIHMPVKAQSYVELLSHAADPKGGLIQLDGDLLHDIQTCQAVSRFRETFEDYLYELVSGQTKNDGSLSDKYEPSQPTLFGGDGGMAAQTLINTTKGQVPNLEELRNLRKGLDPETWIIGNAYPRINFEVSWTDNGFHGRSISWSGYWTINDKFDLVGDEEKSPAYRKAAFYLEGAYHGFWGGRKKAWIQAKWSDSGKLSRVGRKYRMWNVLEPSTLKYSPRVGPMGR